MGFCPPPTHPPPPVATPLQVPLILEPTEFETEKTIHTSPMVMHTRPSGVSPFEKRSLSDSFCRTSVFNSSSSCCLAADKLCKSLLFQYCGINLYKTNKMRWISPRSRCCFKHWATGTQIAERKLWWVFGTCNIHTMYTINLLLSAPSQISASPLLSAPSPS